MKGNLLVRVRAVRGGDGLVRQSPDRLLLVRGSCAGPEREGGLQQGWEGLEHAGLGEGGLRAAGGSGACAGSGRGRGTAKGGAHLREAGDTQEVYGEYLT